MTLDNWIQLLIPFVGIVIAAVSAGLSYYFAKKAKILSDERRLKEKYYLEFVNALSNNVLSDDAQDAKNRLAMAHNNILLVGSAEVVANLRTFCQYIGPATIGFAQTRHDEMLTSLIRSMRIDLYHKADINVGYPIIAVIGKHHR